MSFERIVHPSYLFGVVFPVLGISYYLSSTLKQRIGLSNDNNSSYNNKYKYTQHNTIFSTNKATVPSEWYNTQAKPWETVASRKKKTAPDTESGNDKTKPKKKKKTTNTAVSKTTKVKKKKKKKKVVAEAKAT
jgi:hypothetical protein